MKKRLIYCIVLLFLAANLQAQLFVNKTNINKIRNLNFLVVSLREPDNKFSGWNRYNIDLTADKGGRFTDSSGKREVELYTLTEILNYVSARGWDFVQLSSAAVIRDTEKSENGHIEHKIIFRRKTD